MKRIVLIIFLIISIQSFASDWVYLNRPSLEGGSSYGDMVVLDSNRFYLVVDELADPQLYISRDKGSSWELLYTYNALFDEDPTLTLPNNLMVTDSNNIYISYSNSIPIIKKSTDGGKTFENISFTENSDRIQELIMYDEETGFLKIGAKAYVTHDGWMTYDTSSSDLLKWTSLEFETFLDSTHLIADKLFKDGSLQRSELIKININDFTIENIYNFEFEQAGMHTVLLDLEIVNNKLSYIVGEKRNDNGHQSRDIIYKGTNGMTHWEKVLDTENFPIFGISQIEFFDEYNGFATGRGKIYMTNDGGKTWDFEYPEDIYMVDGVLRRPEIQYAAWLGHTPVFITDEARVFRYEGNYFKFGQSKMVFSPEVIYPGGCSERNLSNTDILKWEKSSGADFYNLEFSTDSLFEDIIQSEYDIEGESYSLTSLQPGLKYFYRIQSGNEQKLSEWSDICNFSIELDRAILSEPSCGDSILSNDIILRWDEVKNAGQYYLEIASDTTFSELILTDTLEDNFAVIDTLASNKLYYWRVSSINSESESNSEYSETCNFYTTVISSVHTDDNSNNLTLYPNPASDFIYLKGIDYKMLSENYEISDINGKELQSGKLESKNKISIESLSPGVYFLKIDNHIVKFVKQ
ncbi:MAG: T9SS type A sorting domain-containing protein [Chlorobiota bacterium]